MDIPQSRFVADGRSVASIKTLKSWAAKSEFKNNKALLTSTDTTRKLDAKPAGDIEANR